MGDMEERVELNYLTDFYGPLLTEHKRELIRQYCEEDMSISEIAEQNGITRQAVSDAIVKGKKKLTELEQTLGLVARYRALTEQARICLNALDALQADAGNAEAMAQARTALENILLIER